jgi:hypothetical protein
MVGLQEDSAGEIATAISAMQYGFNQEQANGSFLNPQLASAGIYNNASADAFFLQSFAQIFDIDGVRRVLRGERNLLILELSPPYTGLFHVSPTTFERITEDLAK